ncbi:MAG: endonuclease [Fermentimonas sp.]|nr:endonuclease [Fermentimonas sp.]
MKYFFSSNLILILLFISFSLHAQVPKGYYSSAEGKSGAELKTALFNTIRNPEVVTYSELWKAFEVTDSRKNNIVWDIYSGNSVGTADYYYTFSTGRCGSYKKEGDCYNREHILPRSWFKGSRLLESDLYHVYPTDGYVNNRRGNLPFGEVGITIWESTNGSKVGQNTFGKYTKTVFEPIDEYKGDIARTYFYMVTAYEDIVPLWSSEQLDETSYPAFSEWSLDLLLKWHREDPVSLKEVRRNEEVGKIQGNRNPYIDYPELVEHVWGVNSSVAFESEKLIDSFMLIECSPFERWLDQQRWVGSLKQYLIREK